MRRSVVSLFESRLPAGRARAAAWSNQELAELYRISDLLNRSGMPAGTDSGLSDEGDPWFVFFHPDSGDVIAHFARIDGLIVAAAFNSGEVIRGTDFRRIVSQIIDHQPLVVPRAKEASNIVRLYLHPAVVLTAFVATALLQSRKALAADERAEKSGDAPHGNGDRTGPTHPAVIDASVTLAGVAGAAAGSASGFLLNSGALATAAALVIAVVKNDAQLWHDLSDVNLAALPDDGQDASSHAVQHENPAPVADEDGPALIAVEAKDAPAASVTETPHLPEAAAQPGPVNAPAPVQPAFMPGDGEAPAVGGRTMAAAAEPQAAPQQQETPAADAPASSAEQTARTDTAPVVSFEVSDGTDFYRLEFLAALSDETAADKTNDGATGSRVDEPAPDTAAADAEPAAPPMPLIVNPEGVCSVELTDAREEIYFRGGTLTLVGFELGSDALYVAPELLASGESIARGVNDTIVIIFGNGSSISFADLYWYDIA